jgi:hypothetical protein
MLKLLLVSLVVFMTGCASVNTANEKQSRDVNNVFRSGNIPAAVAGIDQAFSRGDPKLPKDTTYYLEKGTMVRNLGPARLAESTRLLLQADVVVKASIDPIRATLAMNPSDFADAFVKSNKLDGIYRPRDYEKTMVSFSLAVNHALARRYDLVSKEAQSMREREDLIQKLQEKNVEAIRSKEDGSSGAISRIEQVKGYPVESLDSKDVKELRNSYQNAAAYYLAGFMLETQPGERENANFFYKKAYELKSIPMFASSLDKNVKVASESDTLIVVESGFLSDVYSHKSTFPLPTKSGLKVVNFVLPARAKNAQFFNPQVVTFGSRTLPLVEAVNLEAMSLRDLKDNMSGFVLRASVSAVIQIAAQEAAHKAIDKNKNDPNAGMKKLMVSLAVNAISSGSVDVRQWKSLPSSIYLARANLPKGKSILRIQTPTGPRAFPVTITQDNEVIHVRLFNGAAVMNNYLTGLSNDKYRVN